MKLQVKNKRYCFNGTNYYPGECFETDSVEGIIQDINWGKLEEVQDQPVVKSKNKKNKEEVGE
jgi:hypothetical protein